VRLAEMLKQIDNPAGRSSSRRRRSKATTWEKIVEAWKAGILSGPGHAHANIIGNTTFAALRVPIDAVAAGIGRSTAASASRAMEPFARVYGNLQGTLDGLKRRCQSDAHRRAAGQVRAVPQGHRGHEGRVIRLPFRASCQLRTRFQHHERARRGATRWPRDRRRPKGSTR
jgi:hypothetical protein